MTATGTGPRPNLCLFDLDETLLPIDSDHAWGRFVVGLGWVDPAPFAARNEAFYADYRAARLDIAAYIAFATEPLQGRPAAELEDARRRFMAEVIGPAIRPAARALVRSHRDRGDRIAIVTATNEFVTAPIAAAFGVDALLAVRLERDAGGTITGRIAGTPSYREGKRTRVEAWLAERGESLAGFDRISVYGDSVNDLPLLEIATDPVATNPSPALARIAQERGWRMLRLFDA